MISQKDMKDVTIIQSEDFAREFQQAIKEEQFILYLLPKFYTETETIFGAEVLVRWMHPKYGLIQPQDFLPQCVEAQFMSELDFYVWEHACQLLNQWKQSEKIPCTFSVKVSEESLYHFETSHRLTSLLQKYNIEQQYFQLEIEEDSIRADIYQAKEAVNQLHDAGFVILLDDFSYGCSSISALNQIAVDMLKVDMKFFKTYDNTGLGEVILASIIKCVNWKGLSVIAECVETKEQYDFANIRGCGYVQGFYFSKPISWDEFEEKYLYNNQQEMIADKDFEEEPKTPLHNLKVLVVDDLEMERELLKKYLQSEYHVQLCESAEAGIEYLKNHHNQVDLVLVDYMMPQMNGIEFLEYCRSDEMLNRIPKIMITSNERAKDQVMAFQAGAYDYLLKPLLPELVRVRVRHALEVNHKIMMIEHEKQIYQHQAETDKATGILNKISFQTQVEQHLKNMEKEENALLILDIDDFKKINDTQGHLVGDEVIKWIATQLTKNFRASDYVGRFGGDEFTIYMINAFDHTMVESKADKIIKIIKKNGQEKFHFPISISIGIGYSNAEDRFDSLFERADEALYQVKNTGKGRYL